MDWRPIETAPEDTWVLVTGGEPDVGSWYGSEDVPSMVVAKFMPERMYEGWYFDNWDGDFRSKYENPTHWMPLPEPPKESA